MSRLFFIQLLVLILVVNLLLVAPQGSFAEPVNGCLDCHTKTDAPSMHTNPAVQISCTECHGGDSSIRAINLKAQTQQYNKALSLAHVLPRNKEKWPSSANPKHSYTDLLKESYEFVKFVNPGDLRVVDETCGRCHKQIIDAVHKSLMTTSAMLWGGASYNNNILPFKRYILGESYDKDGVAREIIDSPPPTAEQRARGALDKLIPLPTWEVLKPGDVFRVFERGGLFVKTQFPEIGNPNPFEEPGKPDVRQSNRGPGTGSRISVPVINIHKTRLNDPHLSFMGTNDHPGDYRSSGCTSCHVIYGNDRDQRHSGPYAKFGHQGKSQSIDPVIPKQESAHPIKHQFTRAIPTSQCMVCHMHQPNMFVNSYLGYTMWDYESDAPHMWPKQQSYPSDQERYQSLVHNPEEAAVRGKWSDLEFLEKVSELNPKLSDTQFADYHGHGWNFRAVYKRDRKGNLLDAKDKKVEAHDPAKFKKAVHLSDIHLDRGMHCVDCHFAQDSHGDGNIYGEVAHSVEIMCEDCHGSLKQRSTLKTSGPAAPAGGNDLSLQRTPFGDLRFIWKGQELYQRSSVTPNLEWRVKQVQDLVQKGHKDYSVKADKAKNTRRITDSEALAHPGEKIACFTCHSSWVTSCAGCHLPIEANWKKESNHYDGKETRNWASYNPQVARDDMFQLGLHGPAKDGKIVPVRSSSALVLSSTDINRQKIYIQQPPTSAAGFSSQAFAPHFPHTVRSTETKQCSDCHISKANDNNAIMAQLLLLGTNFVNFMGHYCYLAASDGGVEAVKVTEWDEPQAVIGSYLHRYAYPDFYQQHQKNNLELEESHTHHGVGGSSTAIQLRGEYLYTTARSGGFRVYDVANIANKGFSERIVTSAVSPLGQDLHVKTQDAIAFVLPTNMPIAPFRKPLAENLEQAMHEIYHYAVIVDSKEGLILVNVDTLQDGDPENNFLERALTWNQDGILNGARSIALVGHYAVIGTEHKLVVLSLEQALKPKLIQSLDFNSISSIAVQFRYLFLTDRDGFHVVDFTFPERAKRVDSASIKLKDARNVYLARSYAYVSAGSEGLVIIDIEKVESPKIYQRFTADGTINDLYDVKIATTNASLFAYLADGANGLKVLQLTDPERVPTFYGFSPEIKPKLIAWKRTAGPVRAISKPLDRDRAVDESGHQVSVFGRLGSRPFNLAEMQRLYLDGKGELYTVD